MAIRLTRTVSFRAVHRLYRAEWTDAENQARFGWTAEAPGHEHVYRCAVTLAGPVDEQLAMVMDLGSLDRLLAEEVVARYDGRHLNHDVPELAGILPTCEALARDVFRRLTGRLPPSVRLVRVRVAEDATLSAECTGDP